MSEPILNLSAWIDRRRKEVGPYADHIVHSVKAYEARITALEAERDRLREALEWQTDIIDKAISENGTDQHRLLLNGEYHTGVVVDWVHYVLTGFAKLSRAALEGE